MTLENQVEYEDLCEQGMKVERYICLKDCTLQEY